jgi:hypothetical protein
VEVGGFPPYPIAFRSIVPKREECSNLTVPVCMSATHIAYGSIRMEPVFMVLAQSSAIAASMAIDKNIPVQQVDINQLQEKLRNDPLLNGISAEILVDDAIHASQVTFEGDWSLKPENVASYGPSLKMAENRVGNSATFSVNFSSGGKYEIMYYSSKFWNGNDLKSIDFEIQAGSKIQKKTVSNLEVSGLSSNDNKGFWMSLGTFMVKKGEPFKVKIVASEGAKGYLPADALLAVPVAK